MDIGFASTGLLTGLREGVEAALIVSIILTYLGRAGARRQFGRVWIGTVAAIVLSAAIGVVLFATIRDLEAPAEPIFEGLAMLLAAGVVTWMLFWMRRTSANIRGELQAGIDRALTDGSVWALSLLAFVAVIREGIETSLFLLGQVTAASDARNGSISTLVGALAGLGVAAVLGYGFYRGARVLNLARFFRWTGIALVFIAAGLLSRAAHEFIEVGWIGFGTGTAFDISTFLPDAGGGARAVVGQLLHALLGYTSAPEWTTLVVWIAYLAAVLRLYTRPIGPSRAAPISEGHAIPEA